MTKYFLYNNDIPDSFVPADQVAIDTESMGLINRRDRLCLVQISNGDNIAHLVKFDGTNYSAPNLREKILENENVLKIFHFGRFDIAIMLQYIGALTKPSYCTKIASRLARTYTDHHSLRELCFECLGIRINKSQQTSDWGMQTLTKEQISYASLDVIHLHSIKKRLDSMLKREDRLDIAQASFDFLPYRAKIDVMGWEQDIFSHKV